MIDLKKAKQVFEQYAANYDTNDDKVVLKINHTYRVMQHCLEIAQSLNLDDENVKLAGLIGLLHDIGRFEQLKRYQSFIDNQTIDHALLGVEILFEQGLIDQFVIDEKFYPLIKTAVFNHNKYEIESGLDQQSYLHCQIIRDGDKIDIFKTGLLESFDAFLGVSKEILENDIISEDIFETFMQEKTILSINRKTDLDRWVSFLALIFGLEFDYSYQYVNKHQYLKRLIKKLDYKNLDSQIKMKKITACSLNYINKKINKA